MPPKLLERADIILQKLENKPVMSKAPEEEKEQLSLFSFEDNHQELIEKLREANVDNMTAREALNFLWDLKDRL